MAGNSKRTLEPGTLDRIRKNLGDIDQEEALRMQKKLGGEILKERSVDFDQSNMPKRMSRASRVIVRNGSKRDSDGKSSSESASTAASAFSSSMADTKVVRSDSTLPDIDARELKLMNRLMMSSSYNLKADYVFFNFIYYMNGKNKERVSSRFANYVLKRHLDHFTNFVGSMKAFIQMAPDSYKEKISTEVDLKYRLLRTIGQWSLREIKVLAVNVETAADSITIPQLIPFTRAIYRFLLTIYFVGDNHMLRAIKEISEDMMMYPNMENAKIKFHCKQASSDWLYIHDQIIRGMYPLLMRMSCREYEEYPAFFKTKINDILKFLNLSKFDLMLPEKKKEKAAVEKTEEKKEEKKEETKIAGQKDDNVKLGIKLLEQMFPQAGFSKLEDHPDLYPYFQPIYNFDDGFNMLHPDNPVQITVVLLKIIEDLFKGLRNVKFNIEADQELTALNDTFSTALNEWASYREDLFDKKYGDYLRHYVNNIYSQKEYPSSQAGKSDLNNLFWRAKYYFLPHLKFSAPILNKPINDTKYKPLYGRTDYLKSLLSILSQRIEERQDRKTAVEGMLNPWESYRFDLGNPVSKRMDVLLGAGRNIEKTAASNANLIKYCLYIVSVLDWWINNPSSPAYTSDSVNIYRISAKDGAPEFSVPVRSDQNTLFTDGVKKAIAAKKAKES